MEPPAACLFDLDGLLLDTEPLHGQAWRQAAARFGTHLDDRQLLQLRGRRRLDCAEQVRRWIAGDGVAPPSREELLAVRQPIAEALLPGAPAMPGARELVSRCGELAIPMAITTSSSAGAVALKSLGHPWLEQIRERVYGDDPELGRGKPAPDPFLLAARRLGVASAECWAFEDSPAGAQAALDAGCRVHVYVAPGIPFELFPAGVMRLTSLAEVRLGRPEMPAAAERAQ
jgi:beta-phosphoglucomutase-like phosphatase (HAD superfamily)